MKSRSVYTLLVALAALSLQGASSANPIIIEVRLVEPTEPQLPGLTVPRYQCPDCSWSDVEFPNGEVHRLKVAPAPLFKITTDQIQELVIFERRNPLFERVIRWSVFAVPEGELQAEIAECGQRYRLDEALVSWGGKARNLLTIRSLGFGVEIARFEDHSAAEQFAKDLKLPYRTVLIDGDDFEEERRLLRRLLEEAAANVKENRQPADDTPSTGEQKEP